MSRFTIRSLTWAVVVFTCGAMVGAGWEITNPPNGSTRTKNANVAGTGGTDAVAGTTAVFRFGWVINDPFNGPEDLEMENECSVTAQSAGNGRMWGCTLGPPTGGWSVSNSVNGAYQPSHGADIAQQHATWQHVVTP